MHLEDSSISFGITGIATEVLRAFQVVNNSKVDAYFQVFNIIAFYDVHS